MLSAIRRVFAKERSPVKGFEQEEKIHEEHGESKRYEEECERESREL